MFFIILTAYITIFVLTIGITLSWFSGSTWSEDAVYMGGPVYLNFQDNAGNNTSGSGSLVMKLPEGWQYLYPSMAFSIEASAMLVGTHFEHYEIDGVTTVTSTDAILRAKVIVESRSPAGEITSLSKDLTDPIMEGLCERGNGGAIAGNTGKWIQGENVNGENYFYYVGMSDTRENLEKATMEHAGNESENAVVTFLDNATVLIPWQLKNDYAGYTLTITIVFQALQAYIPYSVADVGVTKHHLEDRYVTDEDVGTDRPISVEVARPVFESAFADIYNGGSSGGEAEL